MPARGVQGARQGHEDRGLAAHPVRIEVRPQVVGRGQAAGVLQHAIGDVHHGQCPGLRGHSSCAQHGPGPELGGGRQRGESPDAVVQLVPLFRLFLLFLLFLLFRPFGNAQPFIQHPAGRLQHGQAGGGPAGPAAQDQVQVGASRDRAGCRRQGAPHRRPAVQVARGGDGHGDAVIRAEVSADDPATGRPEVAHRPGEPGGEAVDPGHGGGGGHGQGQEQPGGLAPHGVDVGEVLGSGLPTGGIAARKAVSVEPPSVGPAIGPTLSPAVRPAGQPTGNGWPVQAEITVLCHGVRRDDEPAVRGGHDGGIISGADGPLRPVSRCRYGGESAVQDPQDPRLAQPADGLAGSRGRCRAWRGQWRPLAAASASRNAP